MLHPVARSAASCVGLLLLGGCGASSTETAAAPEPTIVRVASTGIAAEGDVGGLSQEDVETAFESLGPAVQRCAEQGLARIDALAGSCTIALRIARDGSAHWAYMKESSLGDRDTERCILDAVRARKWPKPLGGEGEALHSFNIDSSVPVTVWEGDHVRSVRGLLARSVSRCMRRGRGRFTATVYVRRDGSVLSAGVAPPSAAAEDKADCVADALHKVKFGKQRSRLTKGTFQIP
jgi:hypothetical protein